MLILTAEMYTLCSTAAGHFKRRGKTCRDCVVHCNTFTPTSYYAIQGLIDKFVKKEVKSTVSES